MMKLKIMLFALLLVTVITTSTWGENTPLNIALFYAANLPINELKAFDIAVIDPDHGLTPQLYGEGKSSLFAYVSLGEADPARPGMGQIQQKWLIGENREWHSKVIDVSNPEWQNFFLEKVLEPLWQAGFRGFFLDTLDSYKLAVGEKDHPRMEQGVVSLIRSIHDRHPAARLILNRGFEIIPQVKENVFAVAAESLFQTFNPATGDYKAVSEKDREWLISRMQKVLGYGIPVIAIDYVAPSNRTLMRQTAEKIKQLGFTPWVTDSALAGLGVGSVEVMPRKVLGLYDGGEGNGDPFFTNLQRYAIMPLNYLGYTVELHDLREPLPEGVLAGRYAGAVIWPYSGRSGDVQNLKPWVLKRIAEGLPLLFLERFGFTLDQEFAASLGLELIPFNKLLPPARVTLKEKSVGFEQQPLPRIDTLLPLKVKNGKPLLQIATANGIRSDAIAITQWGGYVAGSYLIAQLMEGQTAWVLNPFDFFKEALRLPDMPVPDTTTENGVRLLLVHLDGDGFESRSEWQGGRLAAQELKESILDRYPIPTTVSVITGNLAPDGRYPAKSQALEKIARSIFALPWVEGASHSFSHPFRWQPEQSDTGIEGETWHSLAIPGYSFNLDTEINGSIRYVNERLMPVGKKARIFQWTGNCLPQEDALRMTYASDLLNINGGSTLITRSNRTLTAVAPLGISRGPWFQVFAPNQNENVYTTLWTENFYGYQRVLETFRLTDTPRRLKPVNIYYHFYSGTKTASLNALKKVYDWATSERLFGVYTSDYVEKVMDFNRTVIARSGDGWLVRNAGALRELRIPVSAGYPVLSSESGIAGFSDHGDSRYIHIAPGGEALVRLSLKPPDAIYLKSTGSRLDSFARTGKGIQMTLSGNTRFDLLFANAADCNIGDLSTSAEGGDMTRVALPKGRHDLAIACH